jgi:hypothetical protein
MWETIISVVTTGILAFANNWRNKKIETEQLQIKTNAEIEIARIAAENGETVAKGKLQKMLKQYELDRQKTFGENTGKKLGVLRLIVGIWVMCMCTGVGVVMILDPEQKAIFCEWFLRITLVVIIYIMGGKMNPISMPSIPRLLRRK